jgi:hypothetical protein
MIKYFLASTRINFFLQQDSSQRWQIIIVFYFRLITEYTFFTPGERTVNNTLLICFTFNRLYPLLLAPSGFADQIPLSHT